MKDLKETAAMMSSVDYKERFAAEYYQLENRYVKLNAMVEKWDKGELNFVPDSIQNACITFVDIDLDNELLRLVRLGRITEGWGETIDKNIPFRITIEQ